MGTDNLSGIKSKNIFFTLFLLPGRIIQWFLYIAVARKGYGQVRMQSRLARSPIMTYIYSIISWIIIIYFVSDYFGFLDVFLKYFVNPFLWVPACKILALFGEENISLIGCYKLFNEELIQN
jgi:hypothetical protein